MTLSTNDAIVRFGENEERVDKFVNQYGSYPTNTGDSVETLPSFIQRKDDEINNRYPGGYVNRGAFASGANYAINDIVTYGGLAYLCLAAYTSGATTPDNDRAHWVIWQGVTEAELAQEFTQRDVLRALSAFGEIQRKYLEPSPVIRPTQAFIDALMSGSVTVVVVGDSISQGADTWYVNGWVQNFTQMLQIQIPWINWNVINLSIGGRNLNQLADPTYTSPDDFYFDPNTGGFNSQFWPDGSTVSGKAWRDYVKDCAPDLIVMAHQENMGTDTNNLENAFASFKAYSDSWIKAPWYCVVSCFLPTKYTNPDYGDAFKNSNTGRQALADWWRHNAIYNGFGLIDTNGVFRMLRDGKRREVVPFVVERDFRYWGDSSKWRTFQGAAPSLSSGTMNFGGGSTMIQRLGLSARDVDINANFAPTSGSVTRISYRLSDDNNSTSGYSVQYDQNSGNITFYYGTAGVANFTVSSPGASHNMRVKATGPIHEIFYNGKRVLRVIHGTGMFAGTVVIGFATGGGTMNGFYLCMAQEFDAAPAYFTEQDIFGNYPADYISNPDGLGGDGIHHLATKGVFLVYLTAAQSFIEQLKGLFERQITVSAGRQNAAITAAVLPSLTDLNENLCKITNSKTRWAMVHISFGYKNTSKDPGVIQLMIDGANYDSWWLPCTTMTQGAGETDPNPRNFSASVSVLLGPGTHNFSLRIGGSVSGALTSGGGGGSRTLAVQVMPS